MSETTTEQATTEQATGTRTTGTVVAALVVAVVVALVLAVVGVVTGGSAGSTPARAAEGAAAAPAAVRTLTVTGRGEVTSIPDQLGFRVAVGVTRPELSDALASSSATLRRVLAALAAYGVRRSDVTTTGLSMDPVYDYPRYGPAVLRGYRVSQRAAVLVRDLARGGAAVTAAVDAGGNRVRVDGIRLAVADPGADLARARDAAVADARERAERYAAASGRTLGEVVTLREVGPGPLPRSTGRALRTAELDAAPSLPVRAGRRELGVTVQVVWEFGPSDR